MALKETNAEMMAKILLDEANLTYSEVAERKDAAGDRKPEGSVWDEGRMDGEFDPADYRKILELQCQAARMCDENPDLEQTTSDMFQAVTTENSEEMLKQVLGHETIRELGRIAVTTFLLRFPTVQSFVNKGHPLVLAADEYMLENADAQNWQDYKNIAEEYSWL